jgi:hypothetical protein
MVAEYIERNGSALKDIINISPDDDMLLRDHLDNFRTVTVPVGADAIIATAAVLKVKFVYIHQQINRRSDMRVTQILVILIRSP